MNAEYRAYLESPEWKERRLQRLALSHSRCEICRRKTLLDVHHLTYVRIFKERMKDLMVLCRPHHDAVEALIADGKLTRSGAVAHLRRKTRRAVLPPKERTASEDYRASLLRDPTFFAILMGSENKRMFKRTLRRRYKAESFFHRLMPNAMILWQDRHEFRKSQPVAA